MRLLRPVLAPLLSLGACLALVAPASAAPPPEPDTARVDAFVRAYLDRNGLSGATVSVVRDGTLVHEAGVGDDSDGQALTPSSRLRIASVSKSFTAFLVLQLVDEGLVGLDDRVRRHLPDLTIGDERADAVTVEQLLTHTSGLPNPTVVGPASTLRDGVGRLRDWELSTDPGTRYAYSNANYWVLARLVEKVRGEPFDVVLRERLLDPLGMDDTTATVTTGTPVDGLARGHVTAFGLAVPADEPEQMVAGAAGIVSTAHDVAAWLAMQQRGGTTPAGERLLSADLVEASHQPQGAAARYGYGWAIGSGTSPQRISHSGVVATANAQQDLVPATGLGVAVLLDSSTVTREHAYAISTGVIAIADGGTAEPGPPVPTLVDLGLGALALLAAGLGVRGVRRRQRWVDRRATWPTWRFWLRLLPQLVAPALAAFLLLVAPTLQDNSLTTGDVVALIPAPSVLLLALAATGLSLTAARVVQRTRTAPTGAP